MLMKREAMSICFNIGFPGTISKILLDDPSRLAPYGVYFANALEYGLGMDS